MNASVWHRRIIIAVLILLAGGLSCTALPGSINPAATTPKVTTTPPSAGTPKATTAASPAATAKAATTAPHQYILEVHYEGHFLFNPAGITLDNGPDISKIPLTPGDNSSGDYAGHFKGEWHATYGGTCSGGYVLPVTIDVAAVEHKGAGGSGTMDFKVKRDMTTIGHQTCPYGSDKENISNGPVNYTFSLPIKDGAAKEFPLVNASIGKLNETYTLRIGK